MVWAGRSCKAGSSGLGLSQHARDRRSLRPAVSPAHVRARAREGSVPARPREFGARFVASLPPAKKANRLSTRAREDLRTRGLPGKWLIRDGTHPLSGWRTRRDCRQLRKSAARLSSCSALTRQEVRRVAPQLVALLSKRVADATRRYPHSTPSVWWRLRPRAVRLAPGRGRPMSWPLFYGPRLSRVHGRVRAKGSACMRVLSCACCPRCRSSAFSPKPLDTTRLTPTLALGLRAGATLFDETRRRPRLNTRNGRSPTRSGGTS
jgi:hypothetical protein